MAHLHNLPQNIRNPTMLENIGQKVQQGAEIVGTLKGIYDAGKVVYGAAKIVGPMAMASLYIFLFFL